MTTDDKKHTPGQNKKAPKIKKENQKSEGKVKAGKTKLIDETIGDSYYQHMETEMLGAYVPTDLKKELKKNAQRHFRSLSQEVIKALIHYIKEVKAGNIKD